MRQVFADYRARLLPRSLPDNAPAFMIVGAQKAGTTALYSFLSQHPGITASNAKELHFFNCEKMYPLGLDFYHSHFPNIGKPQLTFDASPGYLFNSYAAKRIFAYNPRIKIIALLRDPVERAFSAWNMYTRRYARNRNWYFEDWLSMCGPSERNYVKRSEGAIFDFKNYILEEFEFQRTSPRALIEAPIVPHGYYFEQLSRFYAYFPKKQILIIENSELREDTVSTLQRTEQFLGMAGHDWSKANITPVFEGNYEGVLLEEDTFRMLSEHYASYNQKLFKMIGKPYDWR